MNTFKPSDIINCHDSCRNYVSSSRYKCILCKFKRIFGENALGTCFLQSIWKTELHTGISNTTTDNKELQTFIVWIMVRTNVHFCAPENHQTDSNYAYGPQKYSLRCSRISQLSFTVGFIRLIRFSMVKMQPTD
jgi:hypothetical protein